MRAVTKNAIFTALALCLVLVTGCVATNQPKGDPVGDERPAVNNEGAAAAKQPNRPPVGVAAELATAEACPEPPPDPQAESRMTTFGQAITDHKVIPRWGMDKVEFATKDKIRTMEDGKLWAYVPDDVLSGRVRVASIYWHGNDVKKYFIRNPHKTIEEARSIERDAETRLRFTARTAPVSGPPEAGVRYTFIWRWLNTCVRPSGCVGSTSTAPVVVVP